MNSIPFYSLLFWAMFTWACTADKNSGASASLPDSTLPPADSSQIAPKILFHGTLQAQTGAIVKIAAPIPAIVDNVLVSPGNVVGKGQVLAYLSHAYILQLQEKFLSVQSQYEYALQDYRRQGELSLEQAASLKTLQKSQSEFEPLEAALNSLKQQLYRLGIVPDSVRPDRLQSRIALRSPINGTLTEMQAIRGQWAGTENLFQITDLNRLEIALNLSAPLWLQINPHDTLQYWTPSQPDVKLLAVVEQKIPSVDETGCFLVRASMLTPSSQPGVLGIPVVAIKYAAHR